MINIQEIFKKARNGDEESIKKFFSGFLGGNEEVKGCGYLGALGYILPEYSFWCITDKRVCGLLIRRGGRVQFTSGYIKLINSVILKQPSLITLWVVLSAWVALLWFLGIKVGSSMLFMLYGIPQWVSIILPLVISVVSIRWIIRAYYKLIKSGCIFLVRESLPIYLFSNRDNLENAQALITKFEDVKRMI